MNRVFPEHFTLPRKSTQSAATANTGEAGRNEILRRADWRFLLPNPTPARALCLTSGMLERAVSATAHETVKRARSESCDLAVVVNPSHAELRYAWDALVPGGALYTEWTLPFFTLDLIRHMLRAGRFERTALYWAYPFPARASAALWLPLESPNALGYVAAQPRALKNRVMHDGWSALARLGWAIPASAIARKPLPLVRQSLQEQAWGWSDSPQHWSWLLLTPGLRSNNKAVMLGFDPQHIEPQVALKYARVREAIPALRNERDNLDALTARLHGALRGVPRVLSYQERGATAALGETVLVGTPLFRALSRETFEPLARQATRWLIELARVSAIPTAESDFQKRIGEPVYTDFVKNFGAVADPALIQRTGEMLAKLKPGAMIFEQRDFSPWNVLLDSAKKLIVLDWESAEPHGVPGLDLIYFLTYLAFFQNNASRTGDFVEAYRALLDPGTFFGRVFAECTALYAAQVGMDSADWRVLRVLTWMLHARSEYARLCADADGVPEAEVLRQSLFLKLVNEELRREGI